MADREKLTKLLDDMRATCDVPEDIDEDGCGTWNIEGGEYIADHLIASGVTVRKTGRWIDNCCYNTCSVCQKSVHVWNDDGDMQNFDFCPNCGARMEAEHG